MKKNIVLMIAVLSVLCMSAARHMDYTLASLEGRDTKGIEDIKAIIFDMDGVLRCSYNPLKGASEMIDWMSSKGIPGVILTNECRYTPLTIYEDLRSMGIPIPATWPIYTSALAVRDFFETQKIANGDTYVLVVGEEGIKEAVNQVKRKNVRVCTVLPKYAELKDETFVVFGAVDRIKIADLEAAATWINSGAKVITTCSDISNPSSRGAILVGMPGHMVHMIKIHAPCNPYSLGKPHPFMMRKAMDHLLQINPGLKREEILFVGDSIDTDIRLAFEHGVKSALVLTGNTRLEGVNAHVIKPDYVFTSVNELWRVLSSVKGETAKKKL